MPLIVVSSHYLPSCLNRERMLPSCQNVKAMETKKINESYYARVIRRYMTSHLDGDLEAYFRSHRICYSKFMTVLKRDDVMFQTYLRAKRTEEEDLPLWRLSIDGAPSDQNRL